ncbi:MAG: class I adenylate-forming enzyme family protein [Gammaproteobacteria bacterium]
MDAAGRLRVLGRADDLLISGGNTIHPREIEDLLIDCPGVDEVAVTSRQDQIWGDLLLALYAGSVSQDEILVWCRKNLTSALRPRAFIQVEELPRNGMGKLDRKALKDMADQG